MTFRDAEKHDAWLKRLRKSADDGQLRNSDDLHHLLVEYERVTTENAAILAVLADKGEEAGLKLVIDNLTAEVEKLKQVIVALRSMHGLSTAPRYRYTATFE